MTELYQKRPEDLKSDDLKQESKFSGSTGHRTKKRGRQQKRWEDNIKEWTGSTTMAGRRLVLSQLWCPNDLSRSWDRLD